VDALNEEEVRSFAEQMVRKMKTIDISFCAIGYEVVQNMNLVDMKVDDFVRPVTLAMQSHFITSTIAASVMKKQRSGVILSLTATPGGIGYPYTGGFAPACAAVETFSHNLAAEVGAFGVRVVNIRSGGSPDSRIFKEAIEQNPKEMAPILKDMENDTMLKKLPMMEDIANVATFLASDLAGKITGVTVDVTSGTTAGFNYKVPRV
jgi:NAD(P)-dependent dehydrogenase (short-subunit alcohol dehydrogenase family)